MRTKHLAVFDDFSWPNTLQPFKKFNLIYGWNGSGKTALSRLLDSLATGICDAFPNLEYKVTIGEADYVHGQPFTGSIRVFNNDYVARNIRVIEGKTNPILVVGEESQAALDQIRADEKLLNGVLGDAQKPGKLALKRQLVQATERIEKELDREFTSIAKTIGAACSTAGATRNYRRPDAQATFAKLERKALLSEEQLAENRSALSQQAEPALSRILEPVIYIREKKRRVSDVLVSLRADCQRALDAQVRIEAIERLVKNTNLAEWVEQGLAVHREHDSKACEFCMQKLPPDRMTALEKHFNDADRSLKEKIDSILDSIELIRDEVARVDSHDEAKVYRQFRGSYRRAREDLKNRKDELAKELAATAKQLRAKRANTPEKMNLAGSLDFTAVLRSLDAANEEIEKHNDLTNNLEAAQGRARERIEKHYLSTILEDIRKKRGQIEANSDAVRNLDDGSPDNPTDLGINALQKRIEENRARVSSAHKSCDQLNAALRAYFGRDDLSYRVETDEKGAPVGFALMRGNQAATLVSEGELTAIAFAHFTVRLGEQGFDLKDAIVAIDDPISSMDGSLLYRVCAAIQKHVAPCRQLFIFTHNMEFFNHMKKWFLHDPSINGGKVTNESKYRLMMIQNSFDSRARKRVAGLGDLDSMLREHETEYHYIFKKLSSFDEDNPEDRVLDMRSIYDYPNLARKLLECFLAFRVPVSGSMYVRMLGLREVNPEIASEDINQVYNFVNSHSHLDTKTGLLEFDTTLAVTGREAIRKTLHLIEQADQKHFKAMTRAVKRA